MSSSSSVFPEPSYQTPGVCEAGNKIILSLKTPKGDIYIQSETRRETGAASQHANNPGPSHRQGLILILSFM